MPDCKVMPAGSRRRLTAADEIISARLKAARCSLGWTQQQLAQFLGISFQQLQKYENGINRIGASRLHDIARAMKLPFSYFFEDAEIGDWIESLGDDGSEDVILPFESACEVFASIKDARSQRLLLRIAEALAEAERHAGSPAP